MRLFFLSSLFAVCAGVGTAHAQDVDTWSEWSDTLSFPEQSETTAVSLDVNECQLPGRLNACDGEEGQYTGIRLVPDAYPFVAQQVTYLLLDEQFQSMGGASMKCDATLDHEVFFFIAEEGQQLEPDPVEIERQFIGGEAAMTGLRMVHVSLTNPIRLEEGESLVIGIEMAGDVQEGPFSCAETGETICALTCTGDGSGDTTWWSGAEQPDYSWVDLGGSEDAAAYMDGFVISGP